MCTSIAVNWDGFYFGRNLDLEYDFGQQVVFTPRNFPFHFRKAGVTDSHLAMIGMAAVHDNYPLYAEAANEKGLCMAGLSFPDNAFYPETEAEEKNNVSPFELIPWILGQCASVREARLLLERTHITAIPFSSELPLTPLHWHIADKNGSLTLETVKDGMKLYDNPTGVLTNNPPFDFHTSNLCRYLNLSPRQPESSVKLKPFGGGFGAIGLPGDFSSPSRFVRAAFLKGCSPVCTDEQKSVAQFFHILDGVSMVDGSVITADGKNEKTIYSCCFSAKENVYYYKTYFGSICTASMKQGELDGESLSVFPLSDEPVYNVGRTSPVSKAAGGTSQFSGDTLPHSISVTSDDEASPLLKQHPM